MWRITRNGVHIASEYTFRTGKQSLRRWQRKDPSATWALWDPQGRKSLGG